jgi:uncharacterized protein
MQTTNYFSAYYTLRNKIDSLAQKLFTRHANYIKCRMKCDLCCMDYSILPVEFHSILNELKKNKDKLQLNPNEKRKDESECIFLKNNLCTIYESRPLICRTHGLPLLFTNDDYEWELSTCELNFKTYDYENFSPLNTYPQDNYNSKLFMLNRKFIADCQASVKYGEFDLIPLKMLAKQL